MACLYITEQGAVLRKSGERVIVQKDGAVLGDIPCLKLDTILLYGNVQVTTQALGEMLDHGIELALFTLGGRLRGQLTPIKAKNIVLRMRQYEIGRRWLSTCWKNFARRWSTDSAPTCSTWAC